MRTVLLVLAFCFMSTFCAPAQDGGNATGITLSQLLDKIDRAVDPENKAKTITTVISKYDGAVALQEIKLQITTMFKAPDKSKTVIKAGAGMPESIELFDGENGWSLLPGMGVRQINGPQLDFMKFTARMSNPANRLRDLFPKIELAPVMEKIEGRDCYKLTCQAEPKLKQLPLAIFIDSQTFLPAKMVIMVFTDMGQAPGTTYFSNYKNLNGIVMPMEQKTHTIGMEMSTRLTSVKFNEAIGDFEFQAPKEFSAPPAEAPAPDKNAVKQAETPAPPGGPAGDKLLQKKRLANKFMQQRAAALEKAVKASAADTEAAAGEDDEAENKDNED